MCTCDISLWSDPVPGIKINRFLIPTLPSPLCSYSREQPFFLQLKDYFWVKTPSLYELPYGTKGSGKCLPWGAGWVGMVASPWPHYFSFFAIHDSSAQVLSQAQTLGSGEGGLAAFREVAVVISPVESGPFAEDLLLRVLAITSYSIPESIQR